MSDDRRTGLDFQLTLPARPARRALYVLLALEALLAALYLLTQQVPDTPRTARELFDMDAEVSLPTWLSSVQLFALGSLLLLAGLGRRQRHIAAAWLALAGCAFLFASADEGAAIHEKITTVALGLELTWLLFEGDHGAWIGLYLAVGLIVLFLARRALAALWRHHRRVAVAFGLGAATFVVGAVGVEILGYEYLRESAPEWQYRIGVAVEEFLELAGISVMLYGGLLLASDRPREDRA